MKTNNYKLNKAREAAKYNDILRETQSITASVDEWTKAVLHNTIGNTLEISGKSHIDDINIIYNSEQDKEASKNNNLGLSKILEQVIDDILDSKTNNDEE